MSHPRTVLACLCSLIARVGPSRADESPLEYVALKDKAITGFAIAATGDVYAATHQGVWHVTADTRRAALLEDRGLPRKQAECFVDGVAAMSNGELFASVGPDALHGGKDGLFRWSPKDG